MVEYPKCPKCGENTRKYGKRKGKQRFQCRNGHLFDLCLSVSGKHGSPSPEPVLEPQPQQEINQPQPQDYATEIIIGSEKPEPEQKPEPEPQQPQKTRTTTEVISDGFSSLLGNLIGDILNETFFKDKDKKKKEQQEDVDFI